MTFSDKSFYLAVSKGKRGEGKDHAPQPTGWCAQTMGKGEENGYALAGPLIN